MCLYLAGVVQQLVLKLADAEDLLEHLVQLLLTEDELRHGAQVRSLWLTPHVLVAPVDAVVLGDPGAQDRLFAQAVDLRQAADPALDVLLEDLAEVVGRAAAALNHSGNTLALQEALPRTEIQNHEHFFIHLSMRQSCHTFSVFLSFLS